MPKIDFPGHPDRPQQVHLHPEPKEVVRARRAAADFQPNDQMEDLIRLRADRPEAFAKLGPRTQLSVGLYESDKTNHAAVTGGAK